MNVNPFTELEVKLDKIMEMLNDLCIQINQLPNNTLLDKPLKVNDVSKYLGLSKSTLYCLTSQRKIPHFKVGQSLFFNKNDLDKWILAHRQKTVNEIEAEA